jgi:regulator of protease activity HflC (stomatin/prohibitin superfamily)
MMIGGFTLVVLVILGLAVVTVFLGVKVVPQGKEYTVERFGATRAHCGPACT